MNRSSEDAELTIRYLLGELPAAEQRRYEARYVADDWVFAELLAAETELIDRYVRNELSPHEHEQFETHFLNSAARRQRVEFARALAELADQASAGTASSPLLSWWRRWWRRTTP